MNDATNRGQSSIVGSILLLGLVVVGMTLVGGYGLYTVTQTSDSPDTFVDCEIEYVDDAVVVTQTGGEHVDESSLDVVIRNAAGESRADLSVDDGDGDGRFETGESARFGSVASETEVLVVSERSVVCRNTVTPPDGADGEDENDDTGGDGGDGDSEDAEDDGDSEDAEDDEDEDADGGDTPWWWDWLFGDGGDDDEGDGDSDDDDDGDSGEEDDDGDSGDGNDDSGGWWWWPW